MMLSVPVLSRTMRPCWRYLIHSFLVPLGDYQLTLRREGGEWQMFPLRVR
jgi:hypothetical protein